MGETVSDLATAMVSIEDGMTVMTVMIGDLGGSGAPIELLGMSGASITGAAAMELSLTGGKRSSLLCALALVRG